jgi:class 3 adenylate cyclase
MPSLRLTAILKTDISGSTPRFRNLPQADLVALLTDHREFVCRLAEGKEGRIVKAQGDGFWITFPSVTAAALAAMSMQEGLQRTQLNKGEDRLAMRIVITLGDVLHEDGDLFGDAVALAARVEAVTPPDEIYISAAARLSVNQAEVRTALVDAFALKGFPEPVPIYRVEQTHRTQVIAGQYILWTDLRGFGRFAATARITGVEKVLDRLLELVGQVCQEYGGINRFSEGDTHCLTFSEADRAMAAVERLAQDWNLFDRREQLNCAMVAALHKGTLYLYRSYALSADLNIAARIVDINRSQSGTASATFVTGKVRRELTGTPWIARLQRVEMSLGDRPQLAGIDVFRLEPREDRPAAQPTKN